MGILLKCDFKELRREIVNWIQLAQDSEQWQNRNELPRFVEGGEFLDKQIGPSHEGLCSMESVN
jgi:hypothetical protein